MAAKPSQAPADDDAEGGLVSDGGTSVGSPRIDPARVPPRTPAVPLTVAGGDDQSLVSLVEQPTGAPSMAHVRQLDQAAAREKFKLAGEEGAQAAASKKEYDTFNAEHPFEKPDIKPFTEKKRERTPLEYLGSWGMIMGLVASARTRQPLLNALSAGGAAIAAMDKHDEAEYERAHDAWKENMDYIIKQTEWDNKQREDHLKVMQNDWALGAAGLKAHYAAVGAVQELAALERGDLEFIEKQQDRQQRALKNSRELMQDSEQNAAVAEAVKAENTRRAAIGQAPVSEGEMPALREKTLREKDLWFSYDNNPFNLKSIGGMKGEGAKGGGPRNEFGQYDTPENGIAASILNAKNKSDKAGGWTFQQMFETLSPSSDGNKPAKMAEAVAGAVGMKPGDKVPWNDLDKMTRAARQWALEEKPTAPDDATLRRGIAAALGKGDEEAARLAQLKKGTTGGTGGALAKLPVDRQIAAWQQVADDPKASDDERAEAVRHVESLQKANQSSAESKAAGTETGKMVKGGATAARLAAQNDRDTNRLTLRREENTARAEVHAADQALKTAQHEADAARKTGQFNQTHELAVQKATANAEIAKRNLAIRQHVNDRADQAESAREAARAGELEVAKERLDRMKRNDERHAQDMAALALTPEELTERAKSWILTKELPSGYGPAATAERLGIIKRGSEMMLEQHKTAGDMEAIRATNQALHKDLKNLLPQADSIESYETTARLNISIMKDFLGRGTASDAGALFNKWGQYVRKEIAGDPDVIALDGMMQTIKGEYAKILSGGVQSIAAVSDSARAETDRLLNINNGYSATMGVLNNVIIPDMNNRRVAAAAEVREVQDKIRGLLGAPTKVWPKPPVQAISALRAHPETRGDFDATFGPGLSGLVLSTE